MSPWISAHFLRRQSDRRLLVAAQRGHAAAFEALVRRHRPSLLAYARRLLPHGRAEDAVQQALLQAWAALDRGDAVHDARAWLHRIVHNASVDMVRRAGPDAAELSELIGGRGTAHGELELRVAARETLAGVAALPAPQREALLRTAIGGESHALAASSLGVTPDAVRGLVYRARANLRGALGVLLTPQLPTWASSLARRAVAVPPRLAGASPARACEALAGCGAAAIAAGSIAAGVSFVPHNLVTRLASPHRGPARRVAFSRHGSPAIAFAVSGVSLRADGRQADGASRARTGANTRSGSRPERERGAGGSHESHGSLDGGGSRDERGDPGSNDGVGVDGGDRVAAAPGGGGSDDGGDVAGTGDAEAAATQAVQTPPTATDGGSNLAATGSTDGGGSTDGHDGSPDGTPASEPTAGADG